MTEKSQNAGLDVCNSACTKFTSVLTNEILVYREEREDVQVCFRFSIISFLRATITDLKLIYSGLKSLFTFLWKYAT